MHLCFFVVRCLIIYVYLCEFYLLSLKIFISVSLKNKKKFLRGKKEVVKSKQERYSNLIGVPHKRGKSGHAGRPQGCAGRGMTEGGHHREVASAS